ncbi:MULTISPECIES: F0F1 ATP synthase subunit A [Aliarcobacter]|jgi:F-type H+-transporting ATPase subunit a|uniref:ATP synthase subunit a n=2 Tax=Aliarcobacter skirrowii TaxID=28200 RepID=A0A2U2C2X2_9BACT|nr:F0F1 ATP synthase subunit A [Aliarcobacter skirrowii]AXX84131.1 ATP synthase, F0 complex, a subunit [Aliarcobacter skirrowii CCUG 10374]AZL53302.1 F0F1 ATP synthase subunit A [Aliarcobacter skirrowii]KAB0621682.1 F0F1 ATP synthase subunit A [Aliarcobacter skirrowii CCUG 10374]MCT7445726.1 F0F1 ATP synthase subunit A [Aliarcobacter skirrowii]MDD2507788.1 F0F1 ATP synthase subunit A [Aliarcobacter skirrowii]
MEGRLFTFLGSIGGHDQVWIILSHFVLVILIVFGVSRFATRKLQLVPTGSQNVMEAFVGGIVAMGRDSMGDKNARIYMPLIGSLALIIFVSNMIGVIPGFEAPTSNINFTAALALIVFVYYNYLGIKKNGFVNYFKHFMGPMPILAPLMFPIEIISHFSRIVSLSFRLFGSVRGDDMFLMVLLMLTPWIVPISGFFLLTIMGVLQAFIFSILTYVYIAGSIMMEEEH